MRSSRAARSIHYGFLVVALFSGGWWGYFYGSDWPPAVKALLGMLVGGGVYLGLRFAIDALGRGMKRLPRVFLASLAAIVGTLVLFKLLGFGLPDAVYYPSAGVLLLAVLILSLSLGRRQKSGLLTYAGILLPLLILGAGGYWFWYEGNDPYAETLPPPSAPAGVTPLAIAGLPDPGAAGEGAVETFTYGSGTDRRRPEYGVEVRWRTPTVDASRLLPEWEGKKKKERERYWGFGVTEFPLNGRVYRPEGEGPFPLVLIVHGNHSMTDYSDGGYAYLGEMLASRGVLAVSIDENFINGHWSGDFRGKEMPVRAWLLLQHLRQWREWTQNPDHDLYRRVDLDRVLLIGHSRGGEAVTIAAAFNRLPAFPDDGLVPFDFQFGIRGVVALAPTDYRYHRTIDLENVSFLSLQGSYDADEVSFWGLRPYRRLRFRDEGDWIKAGVYLHRANHGQFNTSWGRYDFGAPGSWLLNTRPLLPAAEQQRAARVFIGAFAEAVLKDNRAYLPLFENVHTAGGWLPDNYYLTHYQRAGDRILQDFEEDIDLTTGAGGIRSSAENLQIWREENLATRDGGSQQNNALVLGWDYGDGPPEPDSMARYTLRLPDTLVPTPDSCRHLLLTLGRGALTELPEVKELPTEAPALDFSVRLTDRSGREATIAVGAIKSIAPPLRSRFLKLASLGKDMIGDDWEVQLETFALPLAAFQGVNGSLAKDSLERIELRFDRSPRGVLVVDEIGWGCRE